MEHAVRKPRVSVFVIILAIILILAIAAGAYFLLGGGRRKEPSRGTYVRENVHISIASHGNAMRNARISV